jgi:hypothetical protein
LLDSIKMTRDLDAFPIQTDSKNTFRCVLNLDSMEPLKNAKVLLGEVEGRKRICPFKIVYTRNYSPFLPGGTLKLSYTFEVRVNSVLQGMPAEGERKEEGMEIYEGTQTHPENLQIQHSKSEMCELFQLSQMGV